MWVQAAVWMKAAVWVQAAVWMKVAGPWSASTSGAGRRPWRMLVLHKYPVQP